MNKHEAIKKVEQMGEYERFVNELIPKLSVLNILNQLDEPEKVKIPQFIADWIKYCKNTNVSIARDLLVGEVDFYNYANQKDLSRLTDFFSDGKNQEIFARAWLDGYTVEEEKRYTVVMKKTKQPLYYNASDDKLFFSMAKIASHFTKQQLEKLNFGWVFDCEGIEVKEVEK